MFLSSLPPFIVNCVYTGTLHKSTGLPGLVFFLLIEIFGIFGNVRWRIWKQFTSQDEGLINFSYLYLGFVDLLLTVFLANQYIFLMGRCRCTITLLPSRSSTPTSQPHSPSALPLSPPIIPSTRAEYPLELDQTSPDPALKLGETRDPRVRNFVSDIDHLELYPSYSIKI